MMHRLPKSIFLLFFLVVICCVIYPVSLWIVGQVFFPFQANGSILVDAEGKAIGSKLIAQPFTHKGYFHPRPSAAAYNAAASASSSLAPSNPALRSRVSQSLVPLLKYKTVPVPADMVMTSASGLDPHITLQNALYQLDRVASWWGSYLNRDIQLLTSEIERILQKHAYAPLGGLAGEKFINVLEVNLELSQSLRSPKKR